MLASDNNNPSCSYPSSDNNSKGSSSSVGVADKTSVSKMTDDDDWNRTKHPPFINSSPVPPNNNDDDHSVLPLLPSKDATICRLCREEGTPQAPLFYPCKCSGSIRYIHQVKHL